MKIYENIKLQYPLTLGKVLYYNLEDIGISGKKEDVEIRY